VPPRDRDIAMVFQNYALYPHMSVEENLAFGLTLRRKSRDEIHTLAESLARMRKSLAQAMQMLET